MRNTLACLCHNYGISEISFALQARNDYHPSLGELCSLCVLALPSLLPVVLGSYLTGKGGLLVRFTELGHFGVNFDGW